MSPTQDPPGKAAGGAGGADGADLGRPTVLLLVRHGRTGLTEAGRFSGRDGPDPGLTPAGRDDAERAGDLLATAYRGVDVLVCSPLPRARQTAGVIATRLGLDPARDVQVDPAWAEVSFGSWEGHTYRDVVAWWPDDVEAWRSSSAFAPPGGESLDDAGARACAARGRLVAAYPGRTVAVVTHMTPVRSVVRETLEAGPAALWRTRVDPGAVTEIHHWADGGCELVTLNRTT